ncbi:hypothetical protein LTR28_005390 [Elasticomyces elasticus]|nr:hypothetical protein LTR28_005390 [Elasticomyces elasticus]
MKYLENGHVTLPDDQKGKPRAGGTVFIYGTTQPSRTETITDAIYWVWQWPTTPNVDPILPNGKDEYYTSCADFDIVDGPIPDTQVHTLVQQDPMPSAVQDFTSRTALTTFPTVKVASSTSSAASAPPAIDSTTLSAISAVSPSSAFAPFAQATTSHSISTTLASITVSETTEVSMTTVILTDYVTVIAPAFTTLITMSGFAAPSGS